MHDSPRVGELQPPASFLGDVNGLLQGEAVVGSVFNDPFNIAATHEFGDHVRLVLLLAQVEHGDDVGMGTEPTHGLGFTSDTGAGDLVQALGLDQGEGYFTVQQGILG